MRKYCSKIAIVLVLFLFFDMFSMKSTLNAYAASRPGTPKISVALTNKEGAVQITIEKTTGAEGYIVYAKAEGATKYTKVKSLKNDGTTKRNLVIENLDPGDATFRVKAYMKKNGKTVYGSYSNEETITIPGSTASVTDFSNLYALLQKNIDKGVLLGGGVTTNSDYIQLGNYDIDNDGKKDPLYWYVIKYSDDKSKALVICDKPVTQMAFSEERGVNTWEKCSLRKWLNNTFYKKAFSKDERSLILKETVVSTDEGKDTKDNIFIIGEPELPKTIVDSYYEDRVETDWSFNNWIYCDYTGYFDKKWYKSFESFIRAVDGEEIKYTSIYKEKSIVPACWIKITPDLIAENNLTVNVETSEKDVFGDSPMIKVYVQYGVSGSTPLDWQILDFDLKKKRVLLLSMDGKMQPDTIEDRNYFTKKEYERILETNVNEMLYYSSPYINYYKIHAEDKSIKNKKEICDSYKAKFFYPSLEEVEKYRVRRVDRIYIYYKNFFERRIPYLLRDHIFYKHEAFGIVSELSGLFHIDETGDYSWEGIENSRCAMWLQLE